MVVVTGYRVRVLEMFVMTGESSNIFRGPTLLQYKSADRDSLERQALGVIRANKSQLSLLAGKATKKK